MHRVHGIPYSFFAQGRPSIPVRYLNCSRHQLDPNRRQLDPNRRQGVRVGRLAGNGPRYGPCWVSHNGARWTAGSQDPGPGVCLGHAERWKPQKVGGCGVPGKCAHTSPKRGLGRAQRLKTAPKGLCWSPRGPHRSVDTSFVIEGGFALGGRGLQGVRDRFLSFRAPFGLSPPTFGPGGGSSHSEQSGDHRREPARTLGPKQISV